MSVVSHPNSLQNASGMTIGGEGYNDYALINELNSDDCTVSIHNQETPPENELFYTKSGGFIDFYNAFGFSLDQFEAIGKGSIYYALEHMNPNNKTLFVHNTLTTIEDINAAQNWSENVYWATCPNANLYIENRLPNYQNFIDNAITPI